MATLWCTFAASAWSKLRSRAAQKAFAESLRPLPFVPAGLVHRAAAATTMAEAGVVLGLGLAVVAVAGGWSPARPLATVMLALTGGLLAVFTAGVALAVRRDTGARCACFGAAEQPLGARHLVRNGLLLAAVAVAVLGIAAARVQPLGLAGVAVALPAGAVGALVLIRLDDLIYLFTPRPVRGSP
ncbi:methylamine utilization protein MauE [Phytohabitans rumicis]